MLFLLIGGSIAITCLAFVVPLLILGILPTWIEVGVDGIMIRWLWRRLFVPIAQIDDVSTEDHRIVLLHLTSGCTEKIHASWRTSVALVARINDILLSRRSLDTREDLLAMVNRGMQTSEQWLAALTKLRDTHEGYRDVAIRDEDLWPLVENPAAPEDARAAAAMVLRRSLDDSGKARLRIAAEATLSPKLRVALDAAADSDEKVFEALRDMCDPLSI
ncbi:MAG: hypothetical protein FWD73_10795 [Polyangiaceae bacterium]|nr:hypothetical protein [Polyangiaceae bacterium]